MSLESLQAIIKSAFDNRNKVIFIEGKTNLMGNFEYKKQLGETPLIAKDDICISFAFTPFCEVNLHISVPFCLNHDNTPLYKVNQETFLEPLIRSAASPLIYDGYGLVEIVSANIPHENGVIDIDILEKYSVTNDGYDWIKSTVSIEEIRYMK